jgi:hypothetical protein
MVKQITIIKAENGFIVRPQGNKSLVFSSLKDLQAFVAESFTPAPEPEKAP